MEIKHCAMGYIICRSTVGYSVPPQAIRGWLGEGARPKVWRQGMKGEKLKNSYWFESDFTIEKTNIYDLNLLHLASMLSK